MPAQSLTSFSAVSSIAIPRSHWTGPPTAPWKTCGVTRSMLADLTGLAAEIMTTGARNIPGGSPRRPPTCITRRQGSFRSSPTSVRCSTPAATATKKRHCYAATDNIVLDVRSGDHLMGDEFTAQGPVTLKVFARGTAPIKKVDVIKNFVYVYSTAPGTEETEFR